MLIQAIEALKASLQAMSAAQQKVKAPTTVRRARQKKEPRCKFCGNTGHLIKECEEAEAYVLKGRCTRDKSGKIVLSSGAEVPPQTIGKTLQERCDRYHQQNTGPSEFAPAAQSDRRPHSTTAEQATQQPTGVTGPDSEKPSEATYTTPKVPAAARAVSAETKQTTAAQLVLRPERTPHPETVPVVPVAQRCTSRRLADVTGEVLPSTEQSFRTCEQVQGSDPAALVRKEAERYSRQYRWPAACAMLVHIAAAGIQDEDRRVHRPIQLWIPRRRAQWRRRRPNPAEQAET